MGPWILGAAALLAAGAIAAVLIANGNDDSTQTVINRTPAVATTNLTPQRSTSLSVTQPTKTVTQPAVTVTKPAPRTTTTTP